MIVLGDTVFPYSSIDPDIFSNISNTFMASPKLVNMEAAIHQPNLNRLASGVCLLSNPSVLNFCEILNIRVASLSNNHITDFDINLDHLKDLLLKNDIQSFGAGANIKEASTPYINHDEKLVALAFGWDVITCKYATEKRAGVNPYEYLWVEENANRYRKQYPNYKLIVVLHCNYEFEMYPQPADRQFAFHLIDIGVNLIVCHHPHIIQGFEKYKGSSIYYSLGNFYFPNGMYNNSNITFPSKSNVGLGVDVAADNMVYVSKLINNKFLDVGNATQPEHVKELMDLSQFAGLSHQEYINFFKVNRIKRKLLPIYRNYNDHTINKVYDICVKSRQRPVDLLGHIKSRLKRRSNTPPLSE